MDRGDWLAVAWVPKCASTTGQAEVKQLARIGRNPTLLLAYTTHSRYHAVPFTTDANVSDNKIIFSMVGVGKLYTSTRKQVLRDIYLSFFYGAKIGVLGLNGSGKSTLLRIIAGLDRDYQGTIDVGKGITFGYLSQEPELEAGKTVREIVEEGAAETVGLLKEYEEVSAKFAEPDADFDVLMLQQAKLQEKIDHLGAWDIDSKLEMAMDALRCPEPETVVDVL